MGKEILVCYKIYGRLTCYTEPGKNVPKKFEDRDSAADTASYLREQDGNDWRVYKHLPSEIEVTT